MNKRGMRSTIPSFNGVPILVAGDVMLDRYWYGDTGRISPEAPVPVVRVRDVEERPGGAGNVALNIARLGAVVTLLGVVGTDEAGTSMKDRLEAEGIRTAFETSAAHPTIAKLRVMSRNQQLIRLDFEEPLQAPKFDGEALMTRFRRSLAQSRAVVLSDYGKGTLQHVPAMIGAAREAGVPVLADPKGRDWSKYRGASVLTPNLSELEAVAGACPDDAAIADRGERIRAELALGALLVTRSEQGMSLLREGHAPVHLPARAREVFDVTGAGDTVIAMLAAAVAVGASLEDAAWLANVAAGLVVAKLGTASVSPDELGRGLAEAVEIDDSGALADEAELMQRLEPRRTRGETVVMTNGCFDVLHAGHVRFLQAAKALGDVLVVAVNDDASVSRLKGKDRPLNALEDRMRVLAALDCVDYVVPFSSDTPEALICRILPDTLVKGGDYRPDKIAGHECVRQAGGEVVVLDYHEGFSTTALIEKAKSCVPGSPGPPSHR